MTAASLVADVRYHAQLMDSGTYRDGFSSDPDTAATLIPILRFVNIAQAIFDRAGFTHVTVPITTVSGQIPYLIPSGLGKFVELTFTYSGVATPLRETTLQDLTARKRDWRQDQGNPNLYMTVGQEVWLYRAPTTAGPLSIRGQAVSPDLTATTDVPILLPAYHTALAMLAALLLINSDSENPGRDAKLNFLLPLWESNFGDVDAIIRARSLLGLQGPIQQRMEGGRDTSQRLQGGGS